MSEASYEARKRPLESSLPEQIEVRVRRERRRHWTPADKMRIVEEAFSPGAVAKRVAERHEISTGLLFTWRRQLRAKAGPHFLPVQLTEAPGRVAVEPSLLTSARDSVIEIEMRNGTRVRVGHGADLKVLRTILTALDRQ
jgi:transposase